MYTWIVTLAAFSLSYAPAVAESIPVSSLPLYEKFRVDLRRSGWVPDYNYGIKNDDGSPMYTYPEVVCGNGLCSAQWIGKIDRRRANFTLWRDDGRYRVAPQIDFPN